MKSFGYKTEAYPNRTIAGADARGLRYSYTTQGIDMIGETYSLKIEDTLYYFHCYYRSSLREESRAVCNKILDSVRQYNKR